MPGGGSGWNGEGGEGGSSFVVMLKNSSNVSIHENQALTVHGAPPGARGYNGVQGDQGLSCSMMLSYAQGNRAYNNLFNNTNNTCFENAPVENLWNTTLSPGQRIYSEGSCIGGNYYTNSNGSGYSDSCSDSDQDGFCDKVHFLETGNVDSCWYNQHWKTCYSITSFRI